WDTGRPVAKGADDVRAPGPAVIDSRDPQLTSIARGALTQIAQDHQPRALERGNQLVRVAKVVVVAETDEYASRRAEIAESARDRILVRNAARDEVPGHAHEVRTKGVGPAHPVAHARLGRVRPAVNVGQLRDAKPIERVWQSRDGDLDADHAGRP